MNKLFATFVIGLVIASITLVKYSQLYLPYFWDEAWPYSSGIHLMYRQGLSLLPGYIPFDVSRGHPLLFYFLCALWIKISGVSLFASHLFPLMVSYALVLVVYIFGRRFFSSTTGLISLLLLAVQPVFLAQSSMLLPEAMLALFSLLTLYFFLLGKRLAYILFAIASLLTKESAVVLILSILIYELVGSFSSKEKLNFSTFFLRNLIILIPLIFSSSFFMLQKVKAGYFFFPLHISAENFQWKFIADKLESFSSFLFIYQGRNGLTTLLLFALLILYFTKKKSFPSSIEKNAVGLLSLYIVFFLIFSSLNHYSPRYLLSILAPFILVASYFFSYTFNNSKWILSSGILILVTTGIYFNVSLSNLNDQSMGYSDAVRASQEAVNFCEQNNLFDKSITANFMMRSYLSDLDCGYLSKGKTFEKLHANLSDDAQYIIAENFELDNSYYPVNNPEFKLIKRFEKNYAWCEVYQRK